MTEVFKTVAECIPVKGARRSIVYDLSRKTYDFIPNALCDILHNDGKTWSELKQDYGNSHKVDEYLPFLLEREYIFFCPKEDAPHFKRLDLHWTYPAQISSAVLVLDDNTREDLLSALFQLESMGCRHFLWLCLKPCGLENLALLLELTQSGTIRSIDIVTRYNAFSVEQAEQYIESHARIRTIAFHSAPFSRMHSAATKQFGLILFSEQAPLLNGDQRDTIRNYFNVNISLFSESQKHNTYYNRKVFIGALGGIYNSADFQEGYGFISTTPISTAIEKQGFKKYWHVHKEQITVCKDCEFRHMCVDSRLPVSENNVWSHTLDCFYNPFTASWKGEEK